MMFLLNSAIADGNRIHGRRNGSGSQRKWALNYFAIRISIRAGAIAEVITPQFATSDPLLAISTHFAISSLSLAASVSGGPPSSLKPSASLLF
jgi:hypothetical protein